MEICNISGDVVGFIPFFKITWVVLGTPVASLNWLTQYQLYCVLLWTRICNANTLENGDSHVLEAVGLRARLKGKRLKSRLSPDSEECGVVHFINLLQQKHLTSFHQLKCPPSHRKIKPCVSVWFLIFPNPRPKSSNGPTDGHDLVFARLDITSST